MQCSGKQGRPEAPLRAPNRSLFRPDDLGKIISLSFRSSICHGDSGTFPFRCFHSFHTYTPYSENNNTFCPGPIAPSVFWSLPCLCPRKPASVDCITWFCYCFALNWVQPVEGTGKALEGKKGKRLGDSLAHTLLPPCPTVVLESPQAATPLSLFYVFFFLIKKLF